MNVSKFKKGDRVRVSGGPYHVTKSGKKVKLGESGRGTFIGVHSDGKGVLVLFEGETSSSYVYIGPQAVSEITGTILRPHKISKRRK